MIYVAWLRAWIMVSSAFVNPPCSVPSSFIHNKSSFNFSALRLNVSSARWCALRHDALQNLACTLDAMNSSPHHEHDLN